MLWQVIFEAPEQTMFKVLNFIAMVILGLFGGLLAISIVVRLIYGSIC